VLMPVARPVTVYFRRHRLFQLQRLLVYSGDRGSSRDDVIFFHELIGGGVFIDALVGAGAPGMPRARFGPRLGAR
jgi:hypothetical protein